MTVQPFELIQELVFRTGVIVTISPDHAQPNVYRVTLKRGSIKGTSLNENLLHAMQDAYRDYMVAINSLMDRFDKAEALK